MKELEDTGKLDKAGYIEGLKRAGLDIPALMSPESTEYQKLIKSFMRNTKTYFGGRVSNYEVEQFLQTIPNLSMSSAGRRRVLANMKYLANAKVTYSDALKEVMRENKGTPPLDLAEQIDDKIGTKLDALAKHFRRELAKPMPQEDDRDVQQCRLYSVQQQVWFQELSKL